MINRRRLEQGKLHAKKRCWMFVPTGEPHGFTEKEYEDVLRRRRNLTSPCSCGMCGNQRRSPYNKGELKLTMQERRHNAKLDT